MTVRTGANTFIGVQITSSAWGTENIPAATDKLEVSNFAVSEGTETLSSNPIGSGSNMINEVQRGAINPTVNFSAIDQFQGPTARLEALLMGRADVAQIAVGAYAHSLFYLDVRSATYASMAFHTSSATAASLPSFLPSDISVTADNPPNYVTKTVSGVASNLDITPLTSAAALLSCTMESTKRVVAKPTDGFWINAQAGAGLAASDKLDITSISIGYSRALEPVKEIRGASENTNGLPREAGSPPFAVTLTVTLRNLNDHTYWTAAQAGTEYKAQFNVQGDLITGSTYYNCSRYFPRLKLISVPEFSLGSAGENPMTLTFACLEAAAAPTGMLATKPYTIYQNALANNLLAV